MTVAPTTELDDPGSLLRDIANRQGPSRGPVSLTSEDAEGGHAVRDHVGKGNAELFRTLQAEAAGNKWLGARIYGVREGSFNDLAAANQYVNDVLDSNPDIVEAVASGRSSGEFIEKRYGSSTGREAY